MRKQMPEKRDYVSSFEWLVLYLNIKSTRGEIPLATDKCSWLNLLRKEEFPLWGVCAAYEWQQIKSWLVSKDYCPSFVIGFFYFRPFFLKPFLLASSSRWVARTTGFWQVQPIFFRMTATLDMQYDIPNFRKIRSLTRDRVQMAPG